MAGKKARKSQISIKVTSEGHFTYDPSAKHVKPGESITWTSSQGPFCISFRDGTPVRRLIFQSVESESGGEWTVTTREVAAVPDPGHFHYAVAVYSDGRVYMDAGCPVIIINDSGD